MNPTDRSLFACFGVELEYMIVREDDLAVVPWADRILVDADGRPVSDIQRGLITWSNELTAHVIELKTTDPVSSLDGLSEAFAEEVREINRRLRPLGARLLPTAMHPLMQPSEARLWTHEFSEVYATFDRIFDCRGHGWSNLQSVHLNLPFASDAEFGRLHAAVRLVLPLLPALAASSPLVEGRATGWPDNRLAHYRSNSAKLPALCGRVIPEAVFTEADYGREIFAPIRGAVAPHDPEGVLEPEFTNSRGAIARFSRQSIEIRLVDLQECPAADLAVVRLIVAWLRELVAESLLTGFEQRSVEVEPLADAFNDCVEQGGAALIREPLILRAAGLAGDRPVTAGELWAGLIARLDPCRDASAAERDALATLGRRGNLAGRILGGLPPAASGSDIRARYRVLAGCLEANRPLGLAD